MQETQLKVSVYGPGNGGYTAMVHGRDYGETLRIAAQGKTPKKALMKLVKKLTRQLSERNMTIAEYEAMEDGLRELEKERHPSGYRAINEDAQNIHCPHCNSTNVECIEGPPHDHICHDCGYTLLRGEANLAAGAQDDDPPIVKVLADKLKPDE